MLFPPCPTYLPPHTPPSHPITPPSPSHSHSHTRHSSLSLTSAHYTLSSLSPKTSQAHIPHSPPSPSPSHLTLHYPPSPPIHTPTLSSLSLMITTCTLLPHILTLHTLLPLPTSSHPRLYTMRTMQPEGSDALWKDDTEIPPELCGV